MPAHVTLSDIRLKIRRRAGIKNQTRFIDDDELDDVANENAERLYNKIAIVQTQEWFRGKWSFTTNSTDITYQLPENFFRPISVDLILDSAETQVISATPYMETERNMFRWLNVWTYGYPAWYRYVGKEISFIPAPGGEYDVRLNYVPTYVPLSQPGSALYVISGFDSWIIWMGVAHCKAKGDEDPSYALGQANVIEADILALASSRDQTGPERVVDAVGAHWLSE